MHIPAHLPEKLTICSWIWAWIAQGRPEEPYGDLERAVVETKARGFNTIRIDAGLNWCFDLQGQPRGAMEFGPWIAGYGSNLRTVNGKGGVTLDVLQRVIRLLELAKQYDLYVILTSWEYQDSTWHVADPRIRAEVYGIPEEARLLHLARQHDRLLTLLKERGLAGRIAFVEPHNEIDYSEFPQGEAGKARHTEAIAFLRDRHPDLLISADLSSQDLSIIPENTQVFDMHLYAGVGMYSDPDGIWSLTIRHPAFDPHRPCDNALLRSLLKPTIVPWSEFAGPAQNVREPWRLVGWMFENLDNAAWDRWMLAHAEAFWPRVKEKVWSHFAGYAAEAARRDIPLVFDEGGWFYPPLGARFDELPEGLRLFDLLCDAAITYGYWGFMCTTYNGPEQPIWTLNPDWLRAVNGRFVRGEMLGVA